MASPRETGPWRGRLTKMPPPSPTITADIALFAALDVGVDPLDELRIGIESRPQQRAFVRVVLVPVVAGQMLEYHFSLPVSGSSAIVELLYRSAGDSVGMALEFPPWRLARVLGIGFATPQ